MKVLWLGSVASLAWMLSLTAASPVSAQPPTDAQIETLHRQLIALIEKARDSPLSASETTLMRGLIRNPEVAEGVPLELALAAIKRSHIDGGYRLSEIRGLVFRRWPKDPRVTAFYRDALETRGPAVLNDFEFSTIAPWDETFLEPVVKLIERSPTASDVARGLRVLDLRYASWAKDPSIAPRLSKSVLQFTPESVLNGMFVWSDMLALTHDRGVIPALLPFLRNQTIDEYTRSTSQPMVRPMRYSELAANAISRLLGEPSLFAFYPPPAVPEGETYNEWRDKKIAALEERLTKLGYRPPR